MELEVIRKAHGIDQDLQWLASSLEDHALRSRVLEVQSAWRDLAYAISASASGMAPTLETPRRRGRRKKEPGNGIAPAVTPEAVRGAGSTLASHTPTDN